MALNPALAGILNMAFDFGQQEITKKIEDPEKASVANKALDTAQEILNALLDDDPNNSDQIIEILDNRLN